MYLIFCISFELIFEYNFQQILQFDDSYNSLKDALFRVEDDKDKIEELTMLVKLDMKH